MVFLLHRCKSKVLDYELSADKALNSHWEIMVLITEFNLKELI